MPSPFSIFAVPPILPHSRPQPAPRTLLLLVSPLTCLPASLPVYPESGEFCFGEWRSEKRMQYLQLQHRRFQEVATSPAGYGIKGYGAITQFFRDVSAREANKSYPLIQVVLGGLTRSLGSWLSLDCWCWCFGTVAVADVGAVARVCLDLLYIPLLADRPVSGVLCSCGLFLEFAPSEDCPTA